MQDNGRSRTRQTANLGSASRKFENEKGCRSVAEAAATGPGPSLPDGAAGVMVYAKPGGMCRCRLDWRGASGV